MCLNLAIFLALITSFSCWAMDLPQGSRGEKGLAEIVLNHAGGMGELHKAIPMLKHRGKTFITRESLVQEKAPGHTGEEPYPLTQTTVEELYPSLTSPEPPVKDVGDEIRSLPQYLSENEAETLRQRMLNAPYTQTEAHYALVSGKDPSNLSSAEMVDDFLRNHQNNIEGAAQDNEFKAILTAAVAEEKINQDKFVFYHGVTKSIAFFFDVISMYHSILSVMDAKQLSILRDFYFAQFSDLSKFLHWIDYFVEVSSGGQVDHKTIYQQVGLAVNPFLFGGTVKGLKGTIMEGESTLSFFHSGTSQNPPDISLVLNNFLEKIGANATYEIKYEAIYNKYFSGKQGRLLQLFIDRKVVDEVAYSSIAGGNPWTFSIEQKDYRGVAKILTAIRENPEIFSNLYEQSSYKIGPNHVLSGTIIDYQCRLFMRPEIFQNQDLVSIKSFWRNPLPNQDMENYHKELQTVILEDIAHILHSHQQNPHENSKSPIKLQKLYRLVYEGQGGSYLPNPRSPSFELQQVINTGDTPRLKELLQQYPHIIKNATILFPKGKIIGSDYDGKLSVRNYIGELLRVHREFPFEFLWEIFRESIDNSRREIDPLDNKILEIVVKENKINLLINDILSLGDIYREKALYVCYKYGSLELLEVILKEHLKFPEHYVEDIDLPAEYLVAIEGCFGYKNAIKPKDALGLALNYGNTRLIFALLEKEQDQGKRIAAFHVAILTGQNEILKCLLASGNMPMNAIRIDGDIAHHVPLSRAAQKNHIDTVSLLLAHGADITSITRSDIRKVLKEGHVVVVDLLLEKGFPLSPEDLKEDIITAFNSVEKRSPLEGLAIQIKLMDYAEKKGYTL